MTLSIRRMALPAALAFALIGANAWAQTTPTAPAPSSPTATGKTPAQKREDAVERRIADLHDRLQITDQQSKPWDAFAQTMRDNARRADEAFHQRAQKLATMTASDAMKSYADLTALHADNMKKLSSAFDDLYAALSPEQKQIADDLYRHPDGPGSRGPHKGGGKGGKGKSAPASASSSGSSGT
ncbi:Spy/CpxP family protein refolding chaperone [Dyella sedimenti]|uniref:Spy/CpxP family protein refolding chaperone n=1 Tax=Dyella sedimenti TaxID=2919947 RepID=UPI001FA993CE|nr:Spy/CpxP family protein refolding chaperone [Dyella sedimenti]